MDISFKKRNNSLITFKGGSLFTFSLYNFSCSFFTPFVQYLNILILSKAGETL